MYGIIKLYNANNTYRTDKLVELTTNAKERIGEGLRDGMQMNQPSNRCTDSYPILNEISVEYGR